MTEKDPLEDLEPIDEDTELPADEPTQETTEGHFFVNVEDGVDVVHRYPAWEQCNLDDTKGGQQVDALTAMAMIARGTARPCVHCSPAE